MTKRVRYNGNMDIYSLGSPSTNLVIGQEYEVEEKKVSSFHTTYVLKGVEGEFNSVFFSDVDDKKHYLALADNIPEEDQSMECYTVIIENNEADLVYTRTSTVVEVTKLEGVYLVTTLNSIYHVLVGTTT